MDKNQTELGRKALSFTLEQTNKNQINPDTTSSKRQAVRKYVAIVGAVFAVGILIHFFCTAVAANIKFSGKSYPNLQINNIDVGSKKLSDIYKILDESLAKSEITIQVDGDDATFQASQVGVTINKDLLENEALKRDAQRIIMPLFLKDTRPLPIEIDSQQLNATISEAFAEKGFRAYKNATFTVNKGALSTKPGTDGIGINDQPLIEALNAHYRETFNNLTYNTTKSAVKPSITESDITAIKSEIISYVSPRFQLGDGANTREASETEKARWLLLTRAKDKVVISIDKKAVSQYVAQLASSFEKDVANQITTTYTSGKPSTTTQGKDGREVENINTVEAELVLAVQEKENYTGVFTFKNIPFTKETRTVDDRSNIKIYTYEVISWGAILSNLDEFAQQAAQTFADSRGWGQADIQFNRVSNGGDFSLVLAEPSRVAAASPGCSSEYSCRSGRYVIINDARWRGATSSWNAAGGSLRDYRHMVINHETGHWLGFGHRYCTGAGQKAPVMQQQSISLQGCTFNPWPTPSEISSL